MKAKLGDKSQRNVKTKKSKRRKSTTTKEETEKKTQGKKKSGGSLCEICNKKLLSRYHLKIHMAVHTGEKNYICGICKKGYQQKWNLITHVARVHSKEKPFKCDDCGKAFGYSSHFKKHVKTHFLEKIEAPETVKRRILNPFKCEYCEKSFETNYRLELHTTIHTGNRPYVCDKCGKCFTTKRLCRIHVAKKHDRGSDFVCDLCGNSFPDRSSIVLHLKTEHDSGDALTCEKHKTESQIRRVMEGISNEPKKEFIACEVCGKSITRENIKKHLNIHYRNRVYSCRYCSKEFLESGQRMVHERKHTGEKPYMCDICGRGHSQYGNLLTHRKRYHNLIGKTPKLWKRNSGVPQSDAECLEKSDSFKNLSEDSQTNNIVERVGPEPEKPKQNEMPNTSVDPEENQSEVTALEPSTSETTKPKYTGNETIEEFLKIATTYVNKKFQESKNENSKSKGKNVFHELLNSQTEKALAEEVLDDPGDPADATLDDDSLDIAANESETQSATGENKSILAKEVKRKINKIIFEKILENLQNTSLKVKASQVVSQIDEMFKTKDGDVLREFLKLMKFVPDNVVMRRTDGKVFWHCWMCESKLRSRHLLARHLLIHEPEENRPYKCDVCRKTFTQSNNFKEHIMSHYNENQFYCEKCGSGFRHKSHFNQHMRRHDPTAREAPVKKYECGYCGKKLNTKYQKMEHERTHTREKPFLCKVCGHQFRALSNLNRHQLTHTNVTHQCGTCLKLFRQKSSLKRHFETHFKYNRVSCECGKTFSQSCSLKKHKMICKNRMEPAVKPFGCLECSKKFLTKSDLKRHVATHDSTKRFKCSVCSVRLKTDETFKRHMRRHEQSQKEVDNSSDACHPT